MNAVDQMPISITALLKLDFWKKWLRLLFIPALIYATGYGCGHRDAANAATANGNGRFEYEQYGALDTKTGLFCRTFPASYYNGLASRKVDVLHRRYPLCVDLYTDKSLAAQYSDKR